MKPNRIVSYIAKINRIESTTCVVFCVWVEITTGKPNEAGTATMAPNEVWGDRNHGCLFMELLESTQDRESSEVVLKESADAWVVIVLGPYYYFHQRTQKVFHIFQGSPDHLQTSTYRRWISRIWHLTVYSINTQCL